MTPSEILAFYAGYDSRRLTRIHPLLARYEALKQVRSLLHQSLPLDAPRDLRATDPAADALCWAASRIRDVAPKGEIERAGAALLHVLLRWEAETLRDVRYVTAADVLLRAIVLARGDTHAVNSSAWVVEQRLDLEPSARYRLAGARNRQYRMVARLLLGKLGPGGLDPDLVHPDHATLITSHFIDAVLPSAESGAPLCIHMLERYRLEGVVLASASETGVVLDIIQQHRTEAQGRLMADPDADLWAV
jgi:hypothetical protein